MVAQGVEAGRAFLVVVGQRSEDLRLAQAQLELALTVHPNGGTRNNLRQKEIASGDPTQQMFYQIFCFEPGFGWTPASGEVDSLYHINLGSPTGGHGADHDFTNTPTGRPLGKYDKTSGPTLAAGMFGPTEYTANIASGEERVVVHYRITEPQSSCNDGLTATAQFRAIIEVPGLLAIPGHPDIALDPPESHPSNSFWFLTPSTISSTTQLGALHRRSFGTPLLLTAASLVQGGINDISSNWDTRPLGHWEHRTGTDIDIDEQAANDQDRIKSIVDLGERLSGFTECEGHPRSNPNHVHCRWVKY